ncbi:partial serine/threonine-protein kinase RsbW, partial [Candidatus Brocadiaceae bacterium]
IRSEVDLGALATLDPDMIETELRNLLTNAIKFSHPGSTVTLSGEVKNSEVILKVADQGVGMSESQIDSLFRIDVKNSHPGTQGEKGTGLGLLLIKEFVQKHNGTIEIRSEPDKGSTFIIRLPQSIQTEKNSVN